MSFFTRTGTLTALALVCTALSACQTTGTASGPSASDIVDASPAAIYGTKKGPASESELRSLESSYNARPTKPGNAIRYAQALRDFEYFSKAAIVLEPFATMKDGSSTAKAEYAAVQLELGNYVVAEDFAKQAIMSDEKNFAAFHYLGLALEGREIHDAAERAFRKALEIWEGDPIPVMNNLGLNLAAQEKYEDAIAILKQAKEADPTRTEVERNLRIVSALYDTKIQSGQIKPKPKTAAAPAPASAKKAPAVDKKSEATPEKAAPKL